MPVISYDFSPKTQVSATRLCPGFLMFLVIWRAARGEHVIGPLECDDPIGSPCEVMVFPRKN